MGRGKRRKQMEVEGKGESEEEGKRKHSGERKGRRLWFVYTVCPSHAHELKAWSRTRGSNH